MSLPVPAPKIGRNYTQAGTATDRHDRGPNYYYGKKRAGSCLYLYKNLGVKREIARINVGFPRLSSPLRWQRCKFIEREDRPAELRPDSAGKKGGTFNFGQLSRFFFTKYYRAKRILRFLQYGKMY